MKRRSRGSSSSRRRWIWFALVLLTLVSVALQWIGSWSNHNDSNNLLEMWNLYDPPIGRQTLSLSETRTRTRTTGDIAASITGSLSNVDSIPVKGALPSPRKLLLDKDDKKNPPLLQRRTNGNNNHDNRINLDGWRSIAVFQGKRKTLSQDENDLETNDSNFENQQNKKQRQQQNQGIRDPEWHWQGQVFQDKMIAYLFQFRTNGYFVDLAANHAVEFSNTFALERRLNWTGLCIEANSQYWESLVRQRSCQVVAAVIGNHQRMKPITFRYKNAGSGIVGFDNAPLENKADRQQRQQQNKKTNEIQNKNQNSREPNIKKKKTAKTKEDMYYTVPLSEILDNFQAPSRIDYLSLDVEGAEDEILNDHFPFDRYMFQVVTVERPPPALIRRLRNHGYRFVQKLAKFGDLLFVHESALASGAVQLTGVPKVNISTNKPWQHVDRNESQRVTNWRHLTHG